MFHNMERLFFLSPASPGMISLLLYLSLFQDTMATQTIEFKRRYTAMLIKIDFVE